MLFISAAANAAQGANADDWPLAWATLGLAISTVIAVVVGVATTRMDRIRADAARTKDAEDADRRLREQLAHSDEQLKRQREHSDKQLAEERTAADERLRSQLAQVDKIEQRGEAAAVQVIAFGIHAGDGTTALSEYPYFQPVIIVRNRGRYSISNVQVKLSNGSSILGSATVPSLPDLGNGSGDDHGDEPADWTTDVIIPLGTAYRGNVTPGRALRFEYDAMAQDTLRTAFPIVRWDDRWDQCWEYRRGVAHLTDRSAEWQTGP